VGRDCLASLQRKTLIFDGTLIFQSFVQLLESAELSELEARPSSHASLRVFMSTSILYADLTVNIPLLSKFHDQKSGIFLVHRGIPKITSQSALTKHSWTFSCFHDAEVALIKSLTSCGGSLDSEAIGLIISLLGNKL
jgi:hypothetical protein